MSTGPSLYRRHRPRTFAGVVGQQHVVRTLQNAVQQGKVHHAYLFVGSRGTGKTSTAKILAACLNCERGPTTEPCGSCESCVSIANATSLDVIEMDAASNNSVDDIRDLRESVAYAPVSGRHKVYILDEAHMLSVQAWNAFLKTLEEPPPRTIFVLATTEAQKVLATVVDRCHRFDFGRPSVEQVARVLTRVTEQEGIRIDDPALALIARHATGSFRDALGTLEQLVTYAGEDRIESAAVLAVLGVADAEQLFDAVDAIVATDPARALRAGNEIAESGRDPGQVLRDLEAHARDLLAVGVLDDVPPELRVTPERDRRLVEQAQALSSAGAVRLLDLISTALQATASGAQARIQLELVLIKAAAPEVDPSMAALLARLERLEHGLGAAGRGLRAFSPAVGTASRAGASPVGRSSAGAPPVSPETSPTSGGAPKSEPAIADSRKPGTAIAAAPPAPQIAEQLESHGDSGRQDTPAFPGPAQLELQSAVELWPAVVATVKQRNAMLAALLADARPVAVGERELTLAFPCGAAFLKRKAEQDDHRRATCEALAAVTGHARVLRYELLDEQHEHQPPQAPILSGEELVRRFLEEFDAEELLDDPDPGKREANH